jgi:hypothetical protein
LALFASQAWIFNRVDTRLKDLWHNESRLQFNWNPSGAGANEGIFSHVLDTHYGAPEITCVRNFFFQGLFLGCL